MSCRPPSLILPWLLASACQPSSAPATSTTVDARPAATAEIGPPTPAPAEPQPRAAPTTASIDLAEFVGPLRFSPVESGDGRLPASNTALIGPDGTMMDHPSRFGWSGTSTHFGWCQPSGGADCETCVLVEVATQKRVEMERGGECERPRARAISAAWKEHGIGKQPIPTSWRFGRDIAIAWRWERGKGSRSSRLIVGGQLGDEPLVRVVSIVEPELADATPDYDIFPEVILPAPDGSRLAILSHGFAGEFSDTVRLTTVAVDDFAFTTYHDGALALLREDPARAVERLIIATAIAPKTWKAWHNLACALVLAGRIDDAREPLERSISVGGAAAREKARQDPDLAPARERTWFATLP